MTSERRAFWTGVAVASLFFSIILAAVSLGHAQAPNPPTCSTLMIDGQSVCNTAVVATHDQVHAGENICASHNGSTAYTCSLIGPNGGKVLASYTPWMPLTVIPDVPCSTTANCTVNVDGVGAITLKAADGTTGAAMNAGYAYDYVFNASGVFQQKAN